MVLAVSGCAQSSDSFIDQEVNPKIDVFGVKMMMDEVKVKELLGSDGEKAMCVYGYEYDYLDSDINIGYNSQSNQVRRITSKNPETAIYGIKPGIELEQAYKLLLANGFKKSTDSKYKFSKNNVDFTIVSMQGKKADGITIEINPE